LREIFCKYTHSAWITKMKLHILCARKPLIVRILLANFENLVLSYATLSSRIKVGGRW